MKEVKKLAFWEVLTTICISYLCVSYINADGNPFHWALPTRVVQLVLIGFSLVIQFGIKNDNF